MEIIYIDLHFLINLLADYLLCLTAGRFCGLILRRRRYFFAALLGAAYSVAVLLPGFEPLSSPPSKLLCALLMGLIAYGAEERPLRCTLAFLGISAAFGGALWALSMAGGTPLLPLKSLALAFALCYAVLSLFFRASGKLPEKSRLHVKLGLLGRESEFFALVDTGNSLTDPVSGSPVMLVSHHALKPLLPGLPAVSAVELLQYADSCEVLKGRFRLVSYKAVGEGGLLAAFRPDFLSIDGEMRDDILIAVCAEAHGEGFWAIF